ncbi:5679_t:CDS:2, partial [Entrophospora sp. SA101]
SIESEEEDIVDLEIIQKIIDTIGIGICHSAKDILCYHVLVESNGLQKQQILKSSDPTIHLCVSDYHYTIALYPGTEKYDLLKFMLNPFLD